MLIFLEGGGFNPILPDFGFLFWSLVTFLILLVILSRIGWGPLTKMIEEREAKVRGDLEAAEKSRREAEAAMARYKAQLDEAQAEARHMLDEARQVAETAKQGILDEARVQAESLKAQATKDIAAAKDKAVADIKSHVVDVAFAISSKIIAKSVDAEEHKRLAGEILAKAGELS